MIKSFKTNRKTPDQNQNTSKICKKNNNNMLIFFLNVTFAYLRILKKLNHDTYASKLGVEVARFIIKGEQY